jgi:hypothetical protein
MPKIASGSPISVLKLAEDPRTESLTSERSFVTKYLVVVLPELPVTPIIKGLNRLMR